MNRSLTLLLALAPQFALVAGLALREEYARATGRELLLEVRAYDPMDALSGRYISTPLAITRIELSGLPHDEELAEVESVWVVLAPGEHYWEPAAVRVERPELAANHACLRARVESVGEHEGQALLELEYPIERFYIPADGRDPSLLWASGEQRSQLAVRVKVTGSGYASVEDLLIDGVSYAEWNR